MDGQRGLQEYGKVKIYGGIEMVGPMILWMMPFMDDSLYGITVRM